MRKPATGADAISLTGKAVGPSPPGDVFLMNPGVPDSLDGRYFGPLPASSIIGRAVPLWTDEGDDGRFVWRAATH